MTRKHFSELIEMSEGGLYQLESGKIGPSFKTLLNLRKHFGVDLNSLLSDDKQMDSSKLTAHDSIEEPGTSLEEPLSDYGEMDKSAIYQELILQRQINEGQKRENLILKEQILSLQEHINTLRQLISALEKS